MPIHRKKREGVNILWKDCSLDKWLDLIYTHRTPVLERALAITQPKPLGIIIEIKSLIVHFLFYMKLHTQDNMCILDILVYRIPILKRQLIQPNGKGLQAVFFGTIPSTRNSDQKERISIVKLPSKPLQSLLFCWTQSSLKVEELAWGI